MCSISGFSVSPNDNIDAHRLAVALLIEGQTRGADATGAAWFNGNGHLWTQKDHMPAKDWTQYCQVPSEARTVILHTRFATQGSKLNNDNNHPLLVHTGEGTGICGVHNGVVWNDDRLYRTMNVEDRRIAEVDSEAIFAAIAFGKEIDEDGNPRLAKSLTGILGTIGGSAAIGWIELGGDPHLLHVSRINQSPLLWAHTEKGSFVYASTKEMLTRAAAAADLKLGDIETMDEGTYLRIHAGAITMQSKYAPLWSAHGWDDEYAYYPGVYNGWQGNHPVPVGTPKALSSGAKADDGGTAPAGTNIVGGDEVIQVSEDEYTESSDGELKRYKYRNGGWVLIDTQKLPSNTTNEDSNTISDEEIDNLLNGIAADDNAIEELMDPNFKPFMGPATLHAHISNTMFNEVDYLDADAAIAYVEREAAISRFVAAMGSSTVTGVGETLDDLGAFFRQGDLVVTDMGVINQVEGQIIGLPPTFPEGEYLLKVRVPNKRYKTGYETVIVGRQLGEFMIDMATSSSDELPDPSDDDLTEV